MELNHKYVLSIAVEGSANNVTLAISYIKHFFNWRLITSKKMFQFIYMLVETMFDFIIQSMKITHLPVEF